MLKILSEDRIFYFYCALLFWMPLPFGSNRPWAWAIMEVWVFSIMAAWCWLFYRNKILISTPLKNAKFVLIFFSVFLFFTILQVMPLPDVLIYSLSPNLSGVVDTISINTISIDRNMTYVSILLGLSYFLIFFLTLALITTKSRLKITAFILLCSGLFQAFYGLLMTLSGIEYTFFIKKEDYMDVATGTFINRNHLAGYLEMTIAIGIGLLIANINSKSDNNITNKLLFFSKSLLSSKTWLRLALIIMVVALLMTHSRMGNIAFLLSLFISGFIYLFLSKGRARYSILILLVSIVIIDLFIVGQWFGLEKLKSRLEQTDVVSEARVDLYKDTFNLIEDYALVGSGLGSFYTVYPQYRGPNIHGYYREAHNDYLQFAAETGIIGILLLALIIIFSLIVAFLALFRRRDPLMRGISFASIMGIIAILIHSTADFNLQIPANAATFMVLLAFCWITKYLNFKEK